MSRDSSTRELADRIATVGWYQSLQLPGGLVTPGVYDTLAELRRIPFPTSLSGMRCLDVATANGFWAFEMERRGAAEVLAVDVPPEQMDWPGNARPASPIEPGSLGVSGFRIARDALGSNVSWQELSVYDLSPAAIGEFDFVFMGSLLLHLRDPVAALRSIASVLRGELLSVDAVSLSLTVLHPRQPIVRFQGTDWPRWWAPNVRAYRQMFGAAKLHVVASGRPFFVKRGAGDGADGAEGAGPSTGLLRWSQAAVQRLGNLHAWVQARAA